MLFRSCDLAAAHGNSSVTLRWSNPAERHTQKGKSDVWTMAIPLSLDGRKLGHIELIRRIDAGTLLFRTGALVALLCGAFTQAVQRASQRLQDEEPMVQPKSA